MSSLTSIEKRYLEDLLRMGGGYVLDFSNSTLADCFRDAVNVDIYDDRYAFRGTSKANRLRAFWERESDALVAKVLSAMLEVVEYNNAKEPQPADAPLRDKCRSIVARLGGKPMGEVTESDFLRKDYGAVSLRDLPVDPSVIPVLESRVSEAELARKAGASLSVIFLCGSILEGVLLGAALQHPKQFNQSGSSPKDKDGKVKGFHDWTLCQFIDVASDVGLIGLDVRKFSHSLRDFRNYIHPYQQLASRFEPSRHTAEICYQVMKACIAYLRGDSGR